MDFTFPPFFRTLEKKRTRRGSISILIRPARQFTKVRIQTRAQVKLLRDFKVKMDLGLVPDPYYGGPEDFERGLI